MGQNGPPPRSDPRSAQGAPPRPCGLSLLSQPNLSDGLLPNRVLNEHSLTSDCRFPTTVASLKKDLYLPTVPSRVRLPCNQWASSNDRPYASSINDDPLRGNRSPGWIGHVPLKLMNTIRHQTGLVGWRSDCYDRWARQGCIDECHSYGFRCPLSVLGRRQRESRRSCDVEGLELDRVSRGAVSICRPPWTNIQCPDELFGVDSKQTRGSCSGPKFDRLSADKNLTVGRRSDHSLFKSTRMVGIIVA